MFFRASLISYSHVCVIQTHTCLILTYRKFSCLSNHASRFVEACTVLAKITNDRRINFLRRGLFFRENTAVERRNYAMFLHFLSNNVILLYINKNEIFYSLICYKLFKHVNNTKKVMNVCLQDAKLF